MNCNPYWRIEIQPIRELSPYLENLVKKVNDLSQGIESWIMVPAQKGHNQNKLILIVGDVKDFVNGNTVVAGIVHQIWGREEKTDLSFVGMQGFSYDFKKHEFSVCNARSIQQSSKLGWGSVNI